MNRTGKGRKNAEAKKKNNKRRGGGERGKIREKLGPTVREGRESVKDRKRRRERKNQRGAGIDGERRKKNSGKSRKMIVEGKETIERWKKQSKGKKRRIHCVRFPKE